MRNGAGRRLLNLRRDPETPIEHLAERFSEYVHMPDPSALYTVMGVLAGSMVTGVPCWLMLIGPPGCGKTMLLDTLKGIVGVHAADSIANEAAFLSGTSKKDRAQGATGGLLRQIGNHGAIVIKDFTGILSMHIEDVKRIMGVMREVYDGSWVRTVGSDGGRPLKWTGKAVMLAGVTGRIDEYHAVSSTLGERWLYFRMNMGDGFAQLRRGLENSAIEKWNERLQELVVGMFQELGLEFGTSKPRRDLEGREVLRIARIAQVAAHCRSGVSRDWHNKEILGPAETEFESRIGMELGQLYVGLEIVGVPERERWKIVSKVALDSMPRLRLMIIDRVLKEPVVGVAFQDIVRAITVREAEGASRAMVDRAVVDLAIHGVLRKERVEGGTDAENGRVRVLPTEWFLEEFRKGFVL